MTAAIKQTAALAILIVFTVALAGCSQPPGQKATIGGLGGAAGGGLLAAAAGGGPAGIAAGVILGGLLGGAIGDRMDAADKKAASEAAARALEKNQTGTPASWKNPDNGNSGTVTPTRTYQSANGRYCREYQQEVIIGGKKEKSFGTACRQPDGNWKIES